MQGQSSSQPSRIALIHATPLSRDPVLGAFNTHWPQAEPVGIMDESLTPDRAREEVLNPEFFERMNRLAQYGVLIGASGVLFTCSAFGEAIEDVQRNLTIPVLKPNEAMFEDALSHGENIAMIYTFAPAGKSMKQEFMADAARADLKASLRLCFADGALDALNAGDYQRHDEIIATTAKKIDSCDAILLAQFSMARAAEKVRQEIEAPVLTSPEASVLKMKTLTQREEN